MQDALTSSARYNSPNSDSSASAKMLTNNRDDANPRYFSYYLYNITNIDDVITTNAYPALQEVGPYAYRHYFQYYDYAWTAGAEGAEQYFSYKSYSWRVFQPAMSFYGSRSLSDSDVITTISPLYVSAFGGFTPSVIRTAATALPKDPTRSPLIPQAGGGALPYFERSGAEYRFRLGVAGVGLAGFVKKFNTLFTGKLPLVSGAGPIIDSPLATAIHLLNSSHFLLNVNPGTSAAVTAGQLTNDILGTLFLTGAVPATVYGKYRLATNGGSFEYWMPNTRKRLSAYLNAIVGGPLFDLTQSKYDISAAQANALYTSLTSTPQTIGPLTCSDWSLAQSSYDSGQISCWAAPLWVTTSDLMNNVSAAIIDASTTSPVWNTVLHADPLTRDQITGLWTWLRVVSTGEFLNYLFDAGGHLGSAYATTATYPTYLKSDFSGIEGTKWNNANLYVKKTVRDILYESNSLLGYLFQSTAALPGSIGLFASSNRTEAEDRLAVSPLYQVNSGIANIDSVDNIVLWNSAPYLPTGNVNSANYSLVSAGYAAVNLTNGYPWSNKFFLDFPAPDFYKYPISITNSAQGTKTKWTPTFAPGKKDGTYGFKNSDLDKSWIIDLWNEDLIAHVPFSYWKDTSVYDIDTWRYTIQSAAYEKNLFFGQYCRACHNLTSAGKPVFFTPPHFQEANTTCLNTDSEGNYFGYAVPGVTTGYSISYLSSADLVSSDADLEPSTLWAWVDMEPISGNLIRGSLKVQVNFLVSTAAGAADPRGVQPGHTTPYLGPQNSGDFMVFPYLWLNKKGQLTSKLADDFKFGIVGGRLAARIVLIVGTIVGGVMLIVSAVFLGIAIKRRRSGTGYDTQGSSTAVAL